MIHFLIPRVLVIAIPPITAFLFGLIEASATNGVDIWGPLAGQGALGMVLAWMLVRTDARMRRIEDELHVSNKTTLLAVISMAGVTPPVKAQAQDLLKQLEVSEESNKRK